MRPLATAALALACASGCVVAVPPPRDLTEARRVLARAETGPLSDLAPDAIQEAEAALSAAEREADADPGGMDAADSAYVALRAAQRAEIAARYEAAREALFAARRGVWRLEGEQARRARERAEEHRRREAEARAEAAFWAAHREALDRARGPADTVVSLAHALVLRMPDAELFWPGTSILRPGGAEHVAALARALPASPRGMIRVTALYEIALPAANVERVMERRREHVLEVLRASGVPDRAILPGARHPQVGAEVDVEVTEPDAGE